MIWTTSPYPEYAPTFRPLGIPTCFFFIRFLTQGFEVVSPVKPLTCNARGSKKKKTPTLADRRWLWQGLSGINIFLAILVRAIFFSNLFLTESQKTTHTKWFAYPDETWSFLCSGFCSWWVWCRIPPVSMMIPLLVWWSRSFSPNRWVWLPSVDAIYIYILGFLKHRSSIDHLSDFSWFLQSKTTSWVRASSVWRLQVMLAAWPGENCFLFKHTLFSNARRVINFWMMVECLIIKGAFGSRRMLPARVSSALFADSNRMPGHPHSVYVIAEGYF